MGDLLINLLASVIAGTAVWVAGFGLRRRKLSRERAFFGLSAGASCLLVVSRHASSPREFSVHRRDVAALVELATIARGCGAHADRVGENQPTGEIGRLTEFCVGGPGGASPRSATHVRTILRGVTYEVFDDEKRRMSFTVGGHQYELSPQASYVLLARFWGPAGGRPVFFIGRPERRQQPGRRPLPGRTPRRAGPHLRRRPPLRPGPAHRRAPRLRHRLHRTGRRRHRRRLRAVDLASAFPCRAVHVGAAASHSLGEAARW
ncbi:hypothetical protein OWR29_41850 [Actinoplanes sp. Pm04-4]|uniref:Uncharacterized protein n=1 Tax=Paractinoplanes pyxinae TaxID=2997416 RepID=A0ABT4BG94_9ACTN|nr:hypothetical protein [Actinoplanes pyxinae]MCY1144583.1 hypothetical protein [Actinoplanes pyxinae]